MLGLFPVKYLAQVKEAKEELFKQKGRGQTDIRQVLDFVKYV